MIVDPTVRVVDKALVARLWPLPSVARALIAGQSVWFGCGSDDI